MRGLPYAGGTEPPPLLIPPFGRRIEVPTPVNLAPHEGRCEAGTEECRRGGDVSETRTSPSLTRYGIVSKTFCTRL